MEPLTPASRSLRQMMSRLRDIRSDEIALRTVFWDAYTSHHGSDPMNGQLSKNRLATISKLELRIYEQRVASEYVQAVTNLAEGPRHLSPRLVAIIKSLQHDLKPRIKIHPSIMARFYQARDEATVARDQARQADGGQGDFRLFAPAFKKLIRVIREKADAVGYKDSLYDACIDEYYPGGTIAQLKPLFDVIQDKLVPLMRRVLVAQNEQRALQGDFSVAKQKELARLMLSSLGFDFTTGRIGQASRQAFTYQVNSYDTRLAIQYDPKDLRLMLADVAHEGGHGLYAQGRPQRHFGMPLGDSAYLGMDEGIARLYEVVVGKSREFLGYWYPTIQKFFPEPFASIDFEDFFKAINYVKRTPRRLDCDELTYDFHIALRVSIERALLEETISVDDLPDYWRQAMSSTLGVAGFNDNDGLLQDIQWCRGQFGSFAAYTIGNMIASQLFEAACKDIPDLREQFRSGSYLNLHEWLRQHVFRHGRLSSTDELLIRATGEPLQVHAYVAHLTSKFGSLYTSKSLV